MNMLRGKAHIAVATRMRVEKNETKTELKHKQDAFILLFSSSH